jgi:hypothetical protein
MKLVKDARSAWRWWSVQSMALAVAVQGAWQMLPPDLAARVPDWIGTAATVAILVLGIVGRLVDQGE